ncbi:MAG TPA: hypothetical protein VL358_08235 [Caulobacteraceae bacterium]|jgi:hypothetical protein|nr:hypothetical protein [Caulobacteraceae bacterium]
MSNRLLAISLMIWLFGSGYAAAAINLQKYSGSESGHLLLSSSAPVGATLTIRITRLDADGEGTFNIRNCRKDHFEEKADTPIRGQPKSLELLLEKRNGCIVDIPLPPGKYEIEEIRTKLNGGLISYLYLYSKEKGAPGIPFEIRTNQVFYVGRFSAAIMWGKTLGVKTFVGAAVLLSDEKSDDFAIASQQFPALSAQIGTAPGGGDIQLP